MTNFGRLPTDTYGTGNGGFSTLEGVAVQWFSPDENVIKNGRITIASKDGSAVISVPAYEGQHLINELELILRNAFDTELAIKRKSA